MKGKIYWPCSRRCDWFSFETNHDLIRRAGLCGIIGRRYRVSVGCCLAFDTIVEWNTGILILGRQKIQMETEKLEWNFKVIIAARHFIYLHWGFLSLRHRTARKTGHTRQQRNGFYKQALGPSVTFGFSWGFSCLFLLFSVYFTTLKRIRSFPCRNIYLTHFIFDYCPLTVCF